MNRCWAHLDFSQRRINDGGKITSEARKLELHRLRPAVCDCLTAHRDEQLIEFPVVPHLLQWLMGLAWGYEIWHIFVSLEGHSESNIESKDRAVERR